MEPLDQITFNVSALDNETAIVRAEREFKELEYQGGIPFDIVDREAMKEFSAYDGHWGGDWIVTITYKKGSDSA